MPHYLSAMFDCIKPSRRIRFEDTTDFIAHATEDGQLFFFGSNRMSGVIEAPVMAVHLTGKHGANLIGIAADGDDGFDVL